MSGATDVTPLYLPDVFDFYNRWISATGVPAMSAEAHRQQGRALAFRGDIRD